MDGLSDDARRRRAWVTHFCGGDCHALKQPVSSCSMNERLFVRELKRFGSASALLLPCRAETFRYTDESCHNRSERPRQKGILFLGCTGRFIAPSNRTISLSG
jgi:hypothetical protein